MDGFKFSMQSFFLLFILGLGFFIPTDLRAKQIFRLPCTSNWWSQDFTSTVNESIGTFDDEVLFQLCDEDGNTPFHVVLKLEHLSENQMFLIAIWADLVGRNGLQFSSNKQGENPLSLFEMRIKRVFERMSNSSLEEVQAMFEEEPSFRREITDEMFLYFIIQIGVMENSGEDVMNGFLYDAFSLALRQMDEDDRERLWEELEEETAANLWH